MTRKLGYLENGTQLLEGAPARMLRFRLPRERWQRRSDITIDGPEPCLPLPGA